MLHLPLNHSIWQLASCTARLFADRQQRPPLCLVCLGLILAPPPFAASGGGGGGDFIMEVPVRSVVSSKGGDAIPKTWDRAMLWRCAIPVGLPCQVCVAIKAVLGTAHPVSLPKQHRVSQQVTLRGYLSLLGGVLCSVSISPVYRWKIPYYGIGRRCRIGTQVLAGVIATSLPF